MLRALLGIVALALACVAGPAQADATHGSTSGVDGVLYNDCLAYPYHWAVDVPGDGTYRALNTTLIGPDGAVVETGYVVPDANLASGTGTFVLCPTDPYGSYTIRATVEWATDADSARQSATLDDSHFTMRKPLTRTSLSARARRTHHGRVVTYRIATVDERPSGYAANAFAWVHLEKKAHGHWVRLKGGRGMTHSTGRVTLRLRHPLHQKAMRVRAVTEPTVRYARSVSSVLRVR
ncbi:MAG: hypothetical protein JF565_04155 [Propionibacteriales bacterium]|nr:hypothetical protein [Propionibacteriales bacterium]